MHDTTTRALWLAVAVLAAAFIGAAAGTITWQESKDAGDAVLVGAGAFGGGLALILTAIRFVTDRSA
ncbi:hypothetical protein OG792_32765 [Micromonospora sp. NBC_01699]|uniref:hypothetical protein n=1 Tax=Micromonospora sp. NBC_01699 TaxID=2975984 RepID=UPI002E2A3F16|nr:hypothetical protein [Micromonospora sp. NBC_01699]